MSLDWSRLGSAIRTARISLGLSQEDLAAAAGISRSTVQGLERGRQPRGRTPHTLPTLERFFGWPPGTAISVAEGHQAPPAHPPTGQTATPSEDASLIGRLPLQIQEELRRGEILGVDVVDLGPTESGGRLIVIAKRDGGEEPDPDQLRELLAEWQRRQRGLRDRDQTDHRE